MVVFRILLNYPGCSAIIQAELLLDLRSRSFAVLKYIKVINQRSGDLGNLMPDCEKKAFRGAFGMNLLISGL